MSGGRKPPYGARNGSRGGYDRSNKIEEIQYEIDPQTREYYAHMAVQQIELLYTIDTLCVDTYFRSYMDEEGYVPMALLASYPQVACYASTIEDLSSKLHAKEDSILEVDVTNETVRLKEGWEMWLMPNSTGAKGVPKYVKEQGEQGEKNQGSFFNGDWCDEASEIIEIDNNGHPIPKAEKTTESVQGEYIPKGDVAILNATATEWVPKVVAPVSAPLIGGKISYAAMAAAAASKDKAVPI